MLGLEFNATLIAQIVDLLIIILFFVGIVTIALKVWSFNKNIYNKIERLDSDLKEMRRMFEEKHS